MPIDRLPEKWKPHGVKLRAWALTDASLFLLIAAMTTIIATWAVADHAAPAWVVLWTTVALANGIAVWLPAGRYAACTLALTVGLLMLRGALLIASGEKWGVVLFFLCLTIARDVWRGTRQEVIVHAY